MSMVRWNPLAELQEMHRKMERLLKQSQELVRESEPGSEPWQPPVEISEDDRQLVIEVDLPGMAQEGIRVQIENHLLEISGERPEPVRGEGMELQRSERHYGPFFRSFSLPAEIDEARTQASCEHGILRIVLMKKREAGGQRIEIEVR